MNGLQIPAIVWTVLAVAALAIPVAFSYTAIRNRKTIGPVLLQWRPAPLRVAMTLWAAAGIAGAVYVYQSTASPSARIIFLAAFFAGWMNALGSAVIVGEKGICIRRRPVGWDRISKYSIWDASGKRYMSISWRGGLCERTAVFVVPSRMKNVTVAIFQHYIPSIQIPRSN